MSLENIGRIVVIVSLVCLVAVIGRLLSPPADGQGVSAGEAFAAGIVTIVGTAIASLAWVL